MFAAMPHTAPNNIEEESEDLFESKSEEEQREVVEEALEEKKEAAAAAPPGLVSRASSTPTPTNEISDSKEEEEDDDDQEEEFQAKAFKIPHRFTKSGRKRAVPFVLKLMKVLSCKEYNDIIAWMPSGKSFNIAKPKSFVAEILPKHFKSAKYSSFTRKLHRWGFTRHYRGEEAGAFFHKYFQKDNLDLVEKMTCHKAESRKTSTAMTSPHARRPSLQESFSTRSPSVNSRSSPPTSVLGTHSIPSSCIPTTVLRSMPSGVPAPTRQAAGHMVASMWGLPQSFKHSEINAAMELEVARRLKERINAASLSRQALVMMQHQMKLKLDPAASFLPDARSLGLANPMSHNQIPMEWPQAAMSFKGIPSFSASRQALSELAAPVATVTFRPYEYPNITAFSGDRTAQSLRPLPQTNIRGARTA